MSRTEKDEGNQTPTMQVGYATLLILWYTAANWFVFKFFVAPTTIYPLVKYTDMFPIIAHF